MSITEKWVALAVVALLTFVPLGFVLSCGTFAGLTIPRENFSELDFLAVAIALAAYVGGVRIALIQRLGSGAQSPLLTKLVVLSLIPADFNLILCGLIMTARVFFVEALGKELVVNWLPCAAFFFIYAVGYLILQHLAAWVISILKFFDLFGSSD